MGTGTGKILAIGIIPKTIHLGYHGRSITIIFDNKRALKCQLPDIISTENPITYKNKCTEFEIDLWYYDSKIYCAVFYSYVTTKCGFFFEYKYQF